MAWLEGLIGALVIYLALNDVFASVIVPRPTPSRYRPAGIFVRSTWRMWCLGVDPSGEGGERRLGIYAPLALIGLVVVWIAMLLLGYGLLFLALGGETRPPIQDLQNAVYVAASSFTTIGDSDLDLHGGGPRTLAIVAAVTGLGVVALTITYLFSLYGSLERRELAVTTLDARAGAPPSGVRLLEEAARSGSTGDLGRLFAEWESWAAHVLDTHQAHPILAYFRSSHDRESWVSAVGALLDAATLMLTTMADGPRGPATFMRGTGAHLVEDLVRIFGLDAGDADAGVERSEFDDAYARLAAAGYSLRDRDGAWTDFAASRAQYAAGLSALARHFVVPPALWISDRSVLGHR
jgi:ion channel